MTRTTVIGTITRWLSESAQRIAAGAAMATRALKAVWAAHERLMDTNELYRAVVTAVASALARQTSLHRLVLAIVSAVMAAYVKARRRSTAGADIPYRGDEPDGSSFA